MSGKDQDYRIFVGGLAWDVTDRQLEGAFDRFGKIIDCQVMLERDTGRPRGFGFLTFADRHAMEDAIREMHGREIGDKVISVNKAQPSGGYSSGDRGSYGGGDRGSYGGGDRSAGQDNCFRCGRPGHWARDCQLEGGGRSARAVSPLPRSRYGGGSARGDRYGSDHRYMDDQYDRGHYADRERFDSRDNRYGSRDRFANDRHPPSGDRFVGNNKYGVSDRYAQNASGKERGFDRDGVSDRYAQNASGKERGFDKDGASDRYAQNASGKERGFDRDGVSDRYAQNASGKERGFDRDGVSDRYAQNGSGKERGFNRDVGPRGGDRYVGGGPARYEGRSVRDRVGPYDRPRRGGGRPPAFDRF